MKPNRQLEDHLRAAAARLIDSATPQLDARVLAKHALGVDDAQVIAAAQRSLTDIEVARLDALIERRARGEPVAYIVGEKEFFGLTFKMAPGVLVPRPDTETLVEAVLKRCGARRAVRILDLGTGSGCILCALLRALPHATGVGLDVNASAIALARDNAERAGVAWRTRWVCGEWEAAPSEGFDIIVSNPPYVPEAERDRLSPDIRDYEDPRALFGGADGLDAYRRIFACLPARIAAQGLIILELGAGAAEAVKRLAAAAFPDARCTLAADLSGTPRALILSL
jgi:release factor glutamine methyltransferase